MSVLVQGTNVTSYIPKGNWGSSTTGISLVQIEGSGTTPTVISTPNAVNSCASNAKTGKTVCTANNTDVYLLSGSMLNSTLTSSGSGTTSFSGGSCTNCGVAMDSVNNKALIGLSTVGGAGFQILDLTGTPAFEPAFASPSGEISEDALIDPIRHLILSPSESNNYELIKVKNTRKPTFFENAVSVEGEMDSAAEDCSTGIALAPYEFSGQVFIADLTQASFTPGSPSGTWTAPSDTPTLFSGLSAGNSGMAVAQGSHLGIVTGEFGGSAFGAVQLPSTSGSGTPAFVDWVQCDIPDDPTPQAFQTGNDPHPVTAYVSPNSGDAMALVANGAGAPPTYLAVIDLTKLLNTSIVARTSAHVCDSSVDLVTAGVVSFVAVP